MNDIDAILQRNREARERIVRAAQERERLARMAHQQQIAKAEAAQIQHQLAQEEAARRAHRELRLEGLPTAAVEVRRALLALMLHYDMYWPEIVGPDRRKHLKLPRAEVYKCLRAFGWSYPKIGRFCKRDHTSIVHALQASGDHVPQAAKREASTDE